MKFGGWVPISKACVVDLPKDRPYTKIEAIYCMQVDYDSSNNATISGYAALWQWPRRQVRNLLKELGVEIKYPEDTSKKRNQRGHISMQKSGHKSGHKADIKTGKGGHKRLIDSKYLPVNPDIKQEKSGHKADIKVDTTSYPRDPDPKNCCPQQEIVDLYHAVLPNLPSVRSWTKKRQALLRARWNSKVPNLDGTLRSNQLEWWRGYFEYVSKSDFLTGRVDPPPGRKRFRATLEWLVTESNFTNVIEGKYN
jgi:hypothetical protein